MTAVVFSPTMWAQRYPELASSVSPSLAQLYFNEAQLYVDNSDTSVIQDLQTRTLILNMLVAHIAKLNATINGQAPSGLVGRISSATEGSVSVSTDMAGVPGGAAWFAQTPYGYQAWAAMAPYRTFRYLLRPCSPSLYGYPWRC